MSNEVLQAARTLIEAKKYEEARMLLKTIDHPTATKWLAKLDEIAPSAKPQKQKQKFSPLLFAGVGAGLLVLLIVVVVLLSNRASTSLNQTHASADSSFSFHYPEGWIARSSTSFSNASLSNPENTLLAEIVVDSPGQIGLDANPTSPIDAARQIVATNTLSNVTIHGTTELSLNNRRAARIDYFEGSNDVVLFLVDLGEGQYARVQAFAPAGELNKHLPTLEAITASIQAQPNFRSMSLDLTMTQIMAEGTALFFTVTQFRSDSSTAQAARLTQSIIDRTEFWADSRTSAAAHELTLASINMTNDSEIATMYMRRTQTQAAEDQNTSYRPQSTATPPAPRVVSIPTVVSPQPTLEISSEAP